MSKMVTVLCAIGLLALVPTTSGQVDTERSDAEIIYNEIKLKITEADKLYRDNTESNQRADDETSELAQTYMNVIKDERRAIMNKINSITSRRENCINSKVREVSENIRRVFDDIYYETSDLYEAARDTRECFEKYRPVSLDSLLNCTKRIKAEFDQRYSLIEENTKKMMNDTAQKKLTSEIEACIGTHGFIDELENDIPDLKNVFEEIKKKYQPADFKISRQ